MRIAMLSTPFIAVPPLAYGGTELVIYDLVEGLVENGHEVTLFATGDSSTSANLRWFHKEAQWPPTSLPEINHVSAAMAEIVADGGFDVIHAHSAMALPFTRLLPNLPLLYTLHHVRDEQLTAFYRTFPDLSYVAISSSQKQAETALKRCEVIHHGLDPERHRWTEKPDDYVCFLGRFAEIKGPHTAIDVAERAGVRIRVAGESHPVDQAFGEREVFPRLAKPHVDFLGCVGLDGKVPLLQRSRALLAPIQWDEPFGLFLVEAMLSGCPVVAFPRGSVPELVEPGVTGFIVRDADEMAELIRPGGPLDSFDRRRCRERAVERFSRKRMVANHERVYAEVAKLGRIQTAPPQILKA
jgi:glycosyltransferase involved in cell wall biosynthesis